jgi:hypothetical protein
MKKSILVCLVCGLVFAGIQTTDARIHPLSVKYLFNPETVVQKQHNAYNSRNIDAFAATFSDDVEVYMFPNELMYKGKEKLRESYESFFKSTPDLYSELVSRTVTGNKVKDEVLITRVKGSKPMKATIYYQIEDGLITKMYFV